MNRRTPSPDEVAATHQAFYGTRHTAGYWASYSGDLQAAEHAILARIGAGLRGRDLLDIGVGGGRTTPHLLAISPRYVGIDFLPQMVEVCRERFPGVDFALCDARDMSKLGRHRFALAFFSFNGIDCVAHSDRQQVYAAVQEVLAPDGWFLFSSHNLRDDSDRLARPWHFTWPKTGAGARSAIDLARHAYHFAGQNLAYLRLARRQVQGDAHALLLDRGQRFRTLTYFVDPVEQVRQLRAAGFSEVLVFDRAGQEHPADSTSLDRVNPVHYLARV